MLKSTCSSAVMVVLGFSCASNDPEDFPEQQDRAEIISEHRSAEYVSTSSSEELQALIRDDLSRGNDEAVYEGLKAMVRERISSFHATRGHLDFTAAEPVTLLLFSERPKYISSVKEMKLVLSSRAERELDAVYDSVRAGDMQRIEFLQSDTMSLLHPDTVAKSPSLRPHALLMNGLVRYSRFALKERPSEKDAREILDTLSEAQLGLSRLGSDEGAFLANAVSAQTLERSRQIDAAAEYWLRVAASDYWRSAPPAFRNLVAARIESHSQRLKERLIVEVEEERRAEIRALEARYERQLSGLRREFAGFDDWVRQELEANSRAVVNLGEEARVNREAIDAAFRLVREKSDEGDVEPGLARTLLSLAADLITVGRGVRMVQQLF